MRRTLLLGGLLTCACAEAGDDYDPIAAEPTGAEVQVLADARRAVADAGVRALPPDLAPAVDLAPLPVVDARPAAPADLRPASTVVARTYPAGTTPCISLRGWGQGNWAFEKCQILRYVFGPTGGHTAGLTSVLEKDSLEPAWTARDTKNGGAPPPQNCWEYLPGGSSAVPVVRSCDPSFVGSNLIKSAACYPVGAKCTSDFDCCGRRGKCSDGGSESRKFLTCS
jgi:hypothetical protein